MSCAATRMLYGQTKANAPSRFLKEIPPELLEEVVSQRSGGRFGGGGFGRNGVGVGGGGSFGGGGFGTTAGGSSANAPRREAPPIGTHIPAGFGADMSLSWEVGEQVQHRKWGIGVILATEGEGDNFELVIKFPDPTGTRKLLAKFAPISKPE